MSILAVVHTADAQVLETTYTALSQPAIDDTGGVLSCALASALEMTNSFFTIDASGNCLPGQANGLQYKKSDQVGKRLRKRLKCFGHYCIDYQ